MKKIKPPPKMSTTEWANTYRFLSSKSSARPGKYSTTLTPWIPGILDAIDDPRVEEVVCQKSAQVAWTDGVINNAIGRIMHLDPMPMIIMFAKEGDATQYSREKLVPMVEVTPVLADKMDVATSRKTGSTALYKEFDGGWLKLVGSNSPGSVKSSPCPFVVVEEPDDCSTSVKGQGDSIRLLRERTKTFSNRKILFGGTPAVKGMSRVEEAFDRSDKRMFFVPCHECDKSHVLSWDYVTWLEEREIPHEIYGKAQPETAAYACPHCSCLWSDLQKNRNVRRAVWQATAEFNGVAGFYINELYSPFEASKYKKLVERFLEAEHKASNGDDSDKIVFVNSALGLPYAYDDGREDAEGLRRRAEADEYSQHEELVCPPSGLLVTAGVDVQHDRVELVIRAWGPGEESWLLFYGAIYAGNACADKTDKVWSALDTALFTPIQHGENGKINVSAVTLDTSDGTTSDAAYEWVRSRAKKHPQRLILAGKGASHGDPEIFTLPKNKIDHKNAKKQTKADRHGVKIYIVGTNKGKDWLAAHMKLDGCGPGRFHYYRGVRDDYFEHMTGEAKVPGRKGGKKVWLQKSGRRVEAWDCEVYALHAARARRVHLMKLSDWQNLENQLKQVDLFKAAEDEAVTEQEDVRRPSSYWGRR